MTEKRFRMVNHDEYDYELDYIMDNYKRMPISDVCDLLNELHEENTILKRRLRSVQSELYCKDRILEDNGLSIECCDKND